MKLVITVLMLAALAFAQTSEPQREDKKPAPESKTTAETKSAPAEMPPANVNASKANSQGGDLQILSNTNGADVAPYMRKLIAKVRAHWYANIPESARPPEMKQGEVCIQFVINRDGTLGGEKLESGSGDQAMDRASWVSIADSAPFDALPKKLQTPLVLRIRFKYNPEKELR